jgi:hypothetical protein
MYRNILKKAGIKNVKSYKKIYGTKENVFAKTYNGQSDSSWYCEIKENGEIIINTKYYDYPKSVIEYNNLINH